MKAGNFNAHQPAWEDSDSCDHGELLLEGIDASDVAFLNKNEPSYISSSYGRCSSIDLTLVDWQNALLYNWSVCKDPWGSDYFPIIVDFNFKVKLDLLYNSYPRLYTRKTNWATFAYSHKCKIERINDFF